MIREQRRGGGDWSRRDLGRAVVGGAIAARFGSAGRVEATPPADSLLGALCRSLRPEQRQALILPNDDPRRSMVQNHWAIVPATIAALTAPQQDLALGLIRQVCTPDGFARLTRARDDDSGGWKHDHLAIFESPTDPKRAEWVVTGRHLTLRGDATGAITGGPLFFGHSVAGPGSIWRDSVDLASELVRSLDGASRDQAWGRVGVEVGELKSDQRELARRLLLSLTGSFRAFEVSSAPNCLTSPPRMKGVIWQGFVADQTGASVAAWRLTGPAWRWSFHAEPHPHVWFDAG